jgi:N-acetylmuramoyl-L-alanine amidase
VAARGEVIVLHGSDTSRVKLAAVAGNFYLGWGTLEKAGARLRTLPSGRANLEVAGVTLELTDGVPFVRVGDRVVPLAAPPRLKGDSVALPLQLLAQLLPRFSEDVSYDAARRTLSLAAAKPAVAVRARRTIIIDAGHGGPDEGTSTTTRAGARITEKSITLAVSTMLGDELKKRGFDVAYTRSRDTLIALQDRGKIANGKRGSAFISVHANAAGPSSSGSSVSGVETYFLSVARTEDAKRVQALENSSVRFEGAARTSNSGDPLSFILSDMQQNDHLRESANLAEQVQNALAAVHPGGNRGVKQAEFAVLVGAFMPSVLVEVGFLSNQRDAAFLVDKANQKKLAVALANATESYFKSYDRRVVASGDGR